MCVRVCKELVGGPGLSGTRPQRKGKEKKRKENRRKENVSGYEKDAQWNIESLHHYLQFSVFFSLMTPVLSQILCKSPHTFTGFCLAANTSIIILTTKDIFPACPLTWSNPPLHNHWPVSLYLYALHVKHKTILFNNHVYIYIYTTIIVSPFKSDVKLWRINLCFKLAQYIKESIENQVP